MTEASTSELKVCGAEADKTAMRLRLLVVLIALLGIAVAASAAKAADPWRDIACASVDRIDRGDVIEEFRHIRARGMSCDEVERALAKVWPWPEGHWIFQRGPWNFWTHTQTEGQVRLVDVHLTRDGSFGVAQATISFHLKP